MHPRTKNIIAVSRIVFTGHNLDILRAHGCCFVCRTDCSEWIDHSLTELVITNVRLVNEIIPTAVVCPDCTSGQHLFERKKNAVITRACT